MAHGGSDSELVVGGVTLNRRRQGGTFLKRITSSPSQSFSSLNRSCSGSITIAVEYLRRFDGITKTPALLGTTPMAQVVPGAQLTGRHG